VGSAEVGVGNPEVAMGSAEVAAGSPDVVVRDAEVAAGNAEAAVVGAEPIWAAALLRAASSAFCASARCEIRAVWAW
jgi:hypothetical protein